MMSANSSVQDRASTTAATATAATVAIEGCARELTLRSAVHLCAREVLCDLAPIVLGSSILAGLNHTRSGTGVRASARASHHCIVVTEVTSVATLLPTKRIVAPTIRQADASIVAMAVFAPLTPAIPAENPELSMGAAIDIGSLVDAVLAFSPFGPAEPVSIKDC